MPNRRAMPPATPPIHRSWVRTSPIRRIESKKPSLPAGPGGSRGTARPVARVRHPGGGRTRRPEGGAGRPPGEVVCSMSRSWRRRSARPIGYHPERTLNLLVGHPGGTLARPWSRRRQSPQPRRTCDDRGVETTAEPVLPGRPTGPTARPAVGRVERRRATVGHVGHGRHGRPLARLPLRRPPHGRWVAGVAAGVAAHLGVPVGVVRLLLALGTVAGGAGLAAVRVPVGDRPHR